MKFLSFFLFFFPLFSSAQNVQEWTLDAFEKRVQNGKDTTYMVNFWATWCRPCVAELPYFEALKQELKEEKIVILLMSVDFPSEKESRLLPFIQKKKLQNEVGLLMEKNENEWIDRVAKEWSGALPGTWVWNLEKNYRKFYEQDFHSVAELKEILVAIKPQN